MENIIPTKRLFNREAKIKERIMSSIKNPLIASLPKKVVQDNIITTNKVSTINTSEPPMFSRVEGSKKG